MPPVPMLQHSRTPRANWVKALTSLIVATFACACFWVAPRAFSPAAVENKPSDRMDWWSLKPLKHPAVPFVTNASAQLFSQSSNPIDAFVAAKLAEKALKPSPEADRRTLVRRVYFDLIGLPPTPERVEQFLHDPDPHAYDHLVD